MRKQLLTAGLIAGAIAATAADRATLTGKVTDNHGKPLDDATVMIYQAGVKKGYSTYCPTCYVDCGKRTVTDQTGTFTIANLDPDLWFELLVVHDGYTATSVKKADPAAGPAATAVLTPRAAVDDPNRVVRGRVVDSHGQPLRAAVVEPIGVEYQTDQGPTSLYFGIDGIEPVAVTNANGEFELAYKQTAMGMMLRVEARGMAEKFMAAPTGTERTTIAVSEGAVIRGRLVNQGKPVPGMQMGLFVHDQGGFGGNLKIMGDPYDEIRIGTQADGSFVIANVPAPVKWYAYGKMESLGALGATDPVEVTASRDGEEIDLGDIQIHPGHRLRGKVTVSDGSAVADGMRLTINSARGRDSQTVPIGRDVRFEFSNLPTGKYSLFASVRGYDIRGTDRGTAKNLETTIDRDVDDFAITLDPLRRR